MTRSEIDDLLARHQRAFKRHDTLALAEQHAEDGVFESPAHGVVHGRDAIEHVYRYWFEAFADLDLTWDSAAIDGDRAAFFWKFSGTSTGPFFGVVSAGTKVEMVGAADYRVANGVITSARHIFDFSGLLMKLGVLKAKPK